MNLQGFSMGAEELLKNHLLKIETRLNELMTFPQAAEEKLFSAARYAVFSKGKRLRPLLTLATTAALNGDIENALTPACVIEFIHSYSLIHDDLPCMDDDDFRRGLLTVHKKFDEATALLAGDFLLTHAFQVLADAPSLDEITRICLIRLVARRAGGEGMIGGQILDLEATASPIPMERMELIHRKKTAELFTAALEFGAIVSKASPKSLSEIEKLGQDLGLAFQIVDDVIDVIASQQKHGKALSSDEINGKTTYVSLLGLEKAQKAAEALLKKALLRIATLPNPEPLALLANSLVKRLM